MKKRKPEAGGPVTVLHGAVTAGARKDEQDVLVQVQAVLESLRRLGFEPAAVPMDLDLQAAAQSLRRLQPRVVFNLVESIGGRDRLMSLAPTLLEGLHFPFTGCSAAALERSGAKLVAKRLLLQEGIPTPLWAAAADIPTAAAELAYPVLLKSAWDHASFGLEELYGSAEQVKEALRRRRRHPGHLEAPPVAELFAESYIAGREFNLSLLEGEGGAEVLPPAEMCFVDYPEGKPKIVGYAAKWDEGSFEYTHTARRFDFSPQDKPLLGRLIELAGRCWDLFELSGYARVDFRVDESGRPWVLEVNANPCLSPDAGFVAAAERAGLGFDAVVERLVRVALRRPGARRGGSRGAESRGAAGTLRAAAPAAEPSGGGFSLRAPAMTLREEVLPGDVGAVRAMAASSGFFSEAEVRLAAELVEERLERGEASGYHFLFAEAADRAGELFGYTCFGAIPCTTASYDLYWIAVQGSGRGQGRGSELLRQTEQRIHRLGGRRIYVETSSRPQYEPTRGFYTRRGYRVEAVLDDFYSPGDGKVIFVKELE